MYACICRAAWRPVYYKLRSTSSLYMYIDSRVERAVYIDSVEFLERAQLQQHLRVLRFFSVYPF
jgi:hypothetical protein